MQKAIQSLRRLKVIALCIMRQFNFLPTWKSIIYSIKRFQKEMSNNLI
jgi:hypothetical protein